MSIKATLKTIVIETESKINDDKSVEYKGYFKITDGNELRFEVADNYIKIGVLTLGLNRTLIEFSKDGDYTVGSVFVYLGREVADKDLAITKRIII